MSIHGMTDHIAALFRAVQDSVRRGAPVHSMNEPIALAAVITGGDLDNPHHIWSQSMLCNPHRQAYSVIHSVPYTQRNLIICARYAIGFHFSK